MAQAPFAVSTQLTEIALAYRNEKLVADMVLPRVPVLSDSFKWSKFTLADSFTVPETLVGRKSRPGEIDWSATEQTDSTRDYALDDAIPGADLARAESTRAVYGVMPVDPRARSTELLTGLIDLAREVRVANLVTTAANYPTANKVTLSGTSQWSHASSDPVSAILTAIDTMLIRPNKMVMGRAVWTKLRQHAKIIAGTFPLGGNASVGGPAASLQAVADLLELDEIIVGEGWVNTAAPGQTPTMTRVWGKHAVMYYEAPNVGSVQGDMTFGFTAQYGIRIAGTIANDPDIGMRGGERVRVGESVKELLAAPDVAYMFVDAVA